MVSFLKGGFIMVKQVADPFLTDPLSALHEYFDGIINVREGTYLFQEGMEVHELYCIQSGLVQISKTTSDGRELALKICKKGDLIGEFSIFSNDPKHIFNAKVLENSSIYFIKKERLECKLFENPNLSLSFLKWMSEQYQITQTKFRDLILNGKKGALYSTLIRMANTYGVETENGILINIDMTNQELANFCGATRESINRMLSNLRKKGVISFQNKKITIHDLQYLKDEINCENCPASYCRID